MVTKFVNLLLDQCTTHCHACFASLFINQSAYSQEMFHIPSISLGKSQNFLIRFKLALKH